MENFEDPYDEPVHATPSATTVADFLNEIHSPLAATPNPQAAETPMTLASRADNADGIPHGSGMAHGGLSGAGMVTGGLSGACMAPGGLSGADSGSGDLHGVGGQPSETH